MMETIIRDKRTESGGGEHPARWRNAAKSSGRWVAVSFGILALLVVLWYVFVRQGTSGEGEAASWSAVFLDMIRWVQGQGLMAALWLVALQALLVVLVIPGPYFTLGAGFIFGLAGGSAVAVAGSTAGAVAAYWIARLGRSARARRSAEAEDGTSSGWWSRLSAHPRLRLLERLILGGDWKVILSTRLVPFFPFKLSNYLFGWLRYPFAPFFWGTFIGIAPLTMVSVSAGALASDLSGLTNPDLTAGSSWMWSLAALGVGMVLLVWSGRRARAMFKEAQR